jgi:hypothetical protein
MTDKENTAAAPASSLIAHMGKRESFLAGATQNGGLASTKAAASNRLFTSKDITGNPRSQQVVPAKAVGLLSMQQTQAMQRQRGNAASRQKTETSGAQKKAGLIVAAPLNARRTFRHQVEQQPEQKKQQVRQFKSLSNIVD